MLGTAHLNQWFWMEGDLASASQGACLEALCRSGRGRGRGWHLGRSSGPGCCQTSYTAQDSPYH